MSELNDRLRSDLTTAMKSRDELRTSTLRMLIAALREEEVAGKQARQLTDEDVVRVLGREAKKRRESAEIYDQNDRGELADRERAEGGVIDDYLPQQLTDDALASLVTQAITEAGATEARQMGLVMKIVQPQVAGRADGKRVSDEVRRQLSG